MDIFGVSIILNTLAMIGICAVLWRGLGAYLDAQTRHLKLVEQQAQLLAAIHESITRRT